MRKAIIAAIVLIVLTGIFIEAQERPADATSGASHGKPAETVPAAVTAYEMAANAEDIEQYMDIFTDDARMVDVSRVFRGKEKIRSWALREVIPHGDSFRVLSIVEQKEGYAQTVVKWMSWEAYYYFWWDGNDKITKMSLQYKD
jgi:hypothetical protein